MCEKCRLYFTSSHSEPPLKYDSLQTAQSLSTSTIGFRPCDGDVLQTADFQEAFNVMSNRFGGNGATEFALPDLRGRIPVHSGTGSGLSQRKCG